MKTNKAKALSKYTRKEGNTLDQNYSCHKLKARIVAYSLFYEIGNKVYEKNKTVCKMIKVLKRISITIKYQ